MQITSRVRSNSGGFCDVDLACLLLARRALRASQRDRNLNSVTKKGVTIMTSSRNGLGCFLAWIVAFGLMAGLAQATPIYSDTLVLGAGDPTQLGRLTRDGVPSDWSAPKPFPGVFNPTTTYHYKTLDLDIAALEAGFTYGGFIQIDFDSDATTTFLSAYLDSYNPLNLAANYLGDPGFSGNAFPGTPQFFQVFVPSAHHLVLVLNETLPNGGLGLPGGLLVEAFADSEFTDLSSVPEPGTLVLLASGMAFAARRFRRGATARRYAASTR
jgi:hypothetical protein